MCSRAVTKRWDGQPAYNGGDSGQRGKPMQAAEAEKPRSLEGVSRGGRVGGKGMGHCLTTA